MPFKRMNRMISFRVSDDEFERLRAKSLAEGSRSVSDYARVALARESGGEREWLEHLQRLSADVQRIAALLDGKAGREA
jgi:hypothetical protein